MESGTPVKNGESSDPTTVDSPNWPYDLAIPYYITAKGWDYLDDEGDDA